MPRIILVTLLSFYMFYYVFTIGEWHFVDNVNLIFHEAGHVIFLLFGRTISLLGGTLTQIIIPLLCFLYFYRNGDRFSASLLLFWLSQNFFNVSVYAGDAIKMELPLLGGSGVEHDWNNILSIFGILKYTENVAGAIYFIGIIILVFAIVFSVRFSFKESFVR